MQAGLGPALDQPLHRLLAMIYALFVEGASPESRAELDRALFSIDVTARQAPTADAPAGWDRETWGETPEALAAQDDLMGLFAAEEPPPA